MVLLLALAASLFFAAGYVLQYHEAHEAPKGLFLSPRLLVELAHHRIWVGGIAAMLVGDGLQAWALAIGSLAVIEPALTVSLLFALPLSAAWRREKLRRSEWCGAVMVSAGLGVLLGVGQPTLGRADMRSTSGCSSPSRHAGLPCSSWPPASAPHGRRTRQRSS